MSERLISYSIAPSFFEPRHDTVFTWLGSAGVLVNARGTIVLIDPLITMIDRNGELIAETGHRLKFPFPIRASEIPRVDAVLYTHLDGDHFAKVTAETLEDRLKPRFLAPPPVQSKLQDMGISGDRLLACRDYESIQIGEAEVVITPALHDWQEVNPWKRGDCCGFLIKVPDGTIWHPGDTRLIDELMEIRGVDVLFFDVAQCRAHLGPEGSARLAQTCGARYLIAYHYGTFDVPPGGPFGSDPMSCLPLVKELSASYLLLNPGEPFELQQGKAYRNI
jgi:L-ascorbate metabolism protein UlaG (beta-lactamase superfamily)